MRSITSTGELKSEKRGFARKLTPCRKKSLLSALRMDARIQSKLAQEIVGMTNRADDSVLLAVSFRLASID